MILLLMNGHEATSFMVANGVRALLMHPELLQLLRDHPELLAGATDALLRYDGSVQMRGARAITPVELSGQQIQPGDAVWLGFAAANRIRRSFPILSGLTLDLRRGVISRSAMARTFASSLP